MGGICTCVLILGVLVNNIFNVILQFNSDYMFCLFQALHGTSGDHHKDGETWSLLLLYTG